MKEFIKDHPQDMEDLASLLWGKSHYFDANNRRFHRSRFGDASTWTAKGCRKEDFGILLTRETCGAGWNVSDGREHKVVIFDTNGCAKVVFRGSSRSASVKAYKTAQDTVDAMLAKGRTPKAAIAKLADVKE